jgi:hypothetical protein
MFITFIYREQDPFTAQDILLDVINNIRFTAFDKNLKDILDTINNPGPVKIMDKNPDLDKNSNITNTRVMKEEVRKKLGIFCIYSFTVV